MEKKPAPAVGRPRLSPEERHIQDLRKKVRRLNAKLAKVQDTAVQMQSISTKRNEIPARELSTFAKSLLNIISNPNP